jgi:hypothetical protein
MSAVISPRARLVDLLWQLKQAYDQSKEKDAGYHDVRFIHFNTLLNDDGYRTEIITRAALSKDRKIKQLGLQLQQLNLDGVLLHKRSSNQPAGEPLILNPDIAETLGQRHQRHRSSAPFAFAIVALVVLASLVTGGYLYRHDLRVLVEGREIISGSIVGEQTWSAGQTWVLDGLVFVEPGSTLTIEAGAHIKGLPGSALIVARGAQIFSRGTPTHPVVFSSAQPQGARRAGDWGGVVLLGNAPINKANANIEGISESDVRGQFGGDAPESSCGVLEYTRIEFAGYEISRDNELNGLTLGGCGAGTIVNYVQVHRGLDDGIEVFGGNVDMSHLVITGADDDSLDWDMGWRGRVQFLVVEQYSSVGDNAFEGDNSKRFPDATPRSAPTIYNATLVSPRSREKHHRAMTIRHGSGGEFRNILVQGFSGESIDIRGTESVRNIDTGDLSFANMLIYDIGSRGVTWFEDEQMNRDDDDGFDERQYFSQAERKVALGTNPMLPRESTSMTQPEFAPATRSPARNNAAQPPAGEFWDEAADYIGAIKPGSLTSWLDQWTAYPIN